MVRVYPTAPPGRKEAWPSDGPRPAVPRPVVGPVYVGGTHIERPPIFVVAPASDSEDPIDELLRKAKLTNTDLGSDLSHLTTATLRKPLGRRLPPSLQTYEGEAITITLKEILTGVHSAAFQLNFGPANDTALSNAFDAMGKVRRMNLSRMSSKTSSNIYRTLIWDMIKKLSILVIHPRIMEEVAKRAFHGVGKSAKKKLFKNNLLFTFALRNILAKVAFHTILREAVWGALKNAMREKKYEMKKDKMFENTIAFVGFNRLMSPNNAHGASISSDIDFKMVFDQSVIGQGLATNQVINRDQTTELVTIMNDALKTYIEEFDKARLTLEVMGFTTKALSDVKRLLKFDEAERNFYASMFYNHIFIAGSSHVYSQFKNEIQAYIENPENNFLIAKRTYNQFLADTDKGSIKVIEHLNYLKDVVDVCGPLLRNYLGSSNGKNLLNDFLILTPLNEIQWQRMATMENLTLDKDAEPLPPVVHPVLQDAWISSPFVFYKLINNPLFKDFFKEAVQDAEVNLKLKALDDKKVFPSLNIRGISDRVDLLQRVAQVVKGLADKEVLDFSEDKKRKIALAKAKEEEKREEDEEEKPKPLPRPLAANAYYQCGSSLSILKPERDDRNVEVSLESGEPYVGKGRISWRFNIKYVGCRLSDWFDSVPFSEYEQWNKSRNARFTYNAAKNFAGCVNGFALSLQTTIYMVSAYRLQPKDGTMVAKAATHETIDILYSRVTREGFMEIMVMSADKSSLVDIRVSIKALVDGLKAFLGGPHEGIVKSVILEGRNVVKDINELAKTKSEKKMRNSSKPFFDALFRLVKATAEMLVP